jgi:Sec-independent protein translocase protein TatA
MISTANNNIKRRNTQLYSLFGLGPGEISIVLLASLLVIGPSKLIQLARSAGSTTGKTTSNISTEWIDGIKSLPAEFNKGVEMGEIDARSRKARTMDNVNEDEPINNNDDELD